MESELTGMTLWWMYAFRMIVACLISKELWLINVGESGNAMMSTIRAVVQSSTKRNPGTPSALWWNQNHTPSFIVRYLSHDDELVDCPIWDDSAHVLNPAVKRQKVTVELVFRDKGYCDNLSVVSSPWLHPNWRLYVSHGWICTSKIRCQQSENILELEGSEYCKEVGTRCKCIQTMLLVYRDSTWPGSTILNSQIICEAVGTSTLVIFSKITLLRCM